MVQFRNNIIFAMAAAVSVHCATINTPASITECIPARLTWTGTSGTVYLTIIPGGQPSAAPLLDLGQFPTGTNGYTWTPSPQEIPAGTSITISLTDSTGTPAYSDQITIREGSGTCAPSSGSAVSGAASETSAATAASSAATSASGAASSVRSAASNAASQATSAGGSAASAAASAATSKAPTSGASSLAAGGLLGAVVAVAGLVM